MWQHPQTFSPLRSIVVPLNGLNLLSFNLGVDISVIQPERHGDGCWKTYKQRQFRVLSIGWYVGETLVANVC